MQHSAGDATTHYTALLFLGKMSEVGTLGPKPHSPFEFFTTFRKRGGERPNPTNAEAALQLE